MPADSKQTSILAAAILAGSAVIGVGLFAGLRRPPPSSPPAAASTSASEPSRAPSAVAADVSVPRVASPDPVVAAAKLARAADEVRRQLTPILPSMTKHCADSLKAAAPDASRSTYLLKATFDERGALLIRGFSRTTSSVPGVASCLNGVDAFPLTISPPGVITPVELEFSLPN